LTLTEGGRSRRYRLHRDGDVVDLDGGAGWRRFVELRDLAAWAAPATAEAGGEGRVRASGPGLVASIAVAAGDPVEPGTPLLVIESMKLFQTLRAGLSGRVAAVACTPGQAVAAGDLLVEIAAAARAEAG